MERDIAGDGPVDSQAAILGDFRKRRYQTGWISPWLKEGTSLPKIALETVENLLSSKSNSY
jgi:hypothetical protein